MRLDAGCRWRRGLRNARGGAIPDDATWIHHDQRREGHADDRRDKWSKSECPRRRGAGIPSDQEPERSSNDSLHGRMLRAVLPPGNSPLVTVRARGWRMRDCGKLPCKVGPPPSLVLSSTTTTSGVKNGMPDSKGPSRSRRWVVRRWRGQALVEFALVIPVFMLILGGVIQFGI